MGKESRLKPDFGNPAVGRVDLPSKQSEREGEAPSGFDRPALGGLQPMCGGGDASPYKR